MRKWSFFVTNRQTLHHNIYIIIIIVIIIITTTSSSSSMMKRLWVNLSNLSWKLPSPHYVSRGQSFNLIAASNFGSCFQGNSLFQTGVQISLQSSFHCIDRSELSQAHTKQDVSHQTIHLMPKGHGGPMDWVCTVWVSQGGVYLWHNNCTEGQSVGT